MRREETSGDWSQNEKRRRSKNETRGDRMSQNEARGDKWSNKRDKRRQEEPK